MNRYRRFVIVVIGLELLFILLCNILYISRGKRDSDRIYKVEAARVASELQERTVSEIDLSKYDTIVNVSEFRTNEICNNEYVVESAGGILYRIEYERRADYGALLYLDIVTGVLFLFTAVLLIYIEKKIWKPFYNMSEITYEMAKGNLSVPIREEKSRFFGRFLWGMDMLRETLESNKEKELALQKEKKELILSLSHDIKTPLSAIELYARALSEELYNTRKKREEALQGITRNAGEIKKYVDEISRASREDFLNLEVNKGEFYLSSVMKNVETYYKDKLSVLHTEFLVEEVSDCLLKGDENRVVEVLQNIIENAVKYGDGKEIRISYSDEEDCKLIFVQNTGNSLKEEELNNLFCSFYRGSNSKNIKGSGLGLYICKNLMRQMDGEIFAQIKNERFIITVVIRKI